MEPALKEKLITLRDAVETGIDRWLPASATRPARLHAAMRYSLEAGGKRLRPALLLLASEVFPRREDPLAAAVAIECLHTYTLIHDDLPAVDNSDLRRGRPACHKQFDEPTALLAGDALLNAAYQLLATHYRQSPALAVDLIRELAAAGSSEQLIGGQMEDIANEGRLADADTLRYIHQNKTAALITAALVMGLRFATDDPAPIVLMREVGFHLGMNFQIVDDILDATSDVETMGKPVGNDADADKSTYVALYGIEQAHRQADQHAHAAVAALHQMGGRTGELVALIESVAKRIH